MIGWILSSIGIIIVFCAEGYLSLDNYEHEIQFLLKSKKLGIYLIFLGIIILSWDCIF